MTLFNLYAIIKERREALGISRAEVERRLSKHGIDLPGITLRDWEEQKKSPPLESRPDFLIAISDALEMDYEDLLDRLGFPIVPVGLTPDGLVIAKNLSLLSPQRRQQVSEAIRAMIQVGLEKDKLLSELEALLERMTPEQRQNVHELAQKLNEGRKGAQTKRKP